MGVLSSLRDERLVFFGLGLATVGFIGMMRLILEHYRDEVEIKPRSPKTQYITQATEDALDLHTLNSLLDHYNPTIRDTATRIVVGRAVNDADTIRYLLIGITRPNYDEREKCLRALVFAVEERESMHEPLKALNTPKAYAAIVRCLELCLADKERGNLNDLLWDEYHLRDVNERRCIMLVQQLINAYGAKMLVAANFIERWLVKQDWGDGDEERQRNFSTYISRRKNRLSDVCSALTAFKEGRKALRQNKLLGKGRSGPRDGPDNGGIKVILEISMSNEDENGEIQQENFQTELVPRIMDQSDEEQRRRRRHREAIVLNDGTHSLGRGDIIEREHDSHA
ncbi:hypothetical protein JX266_013468 [Neoarthrinium moseri]|uniref:uncharacterized protein n=1 Tax=Neoarthrinium moseri TaxID=1658444 RepID=UPI001FDCB714|nr:uncharacterized protein JN550_003769 [Neoarthrinium moseri]KAI1840336.1 hypothetical protein JX266_013468 [Neoarthrinium moseri]KAI1872895.1 hypothetical protein JN550_003769 [Neoarthrinium moseri]